MPIFKNCSKIIHIISFVSDFLFGKIRHRALIQASTNDIDLKIRNTYKKSCCVSCDVTCDSLSGFFPVSGSPTVETVEENGLS